MDSPESLLAGGKLHGERQASCTGSGNRAAWGAVTELHRGRRCGWWLLPPTPTQLLPDPGEGATSTLLHPASPSCVPASWGLRATTATTSLPIRRSARDPSCRAPASSSSVTPVVGPSPPLPRDFFLLLRAPPTVPRDPRSRILPSPTVTALCFSLPPSPVPPPWATSTGSCCGPPRPRIC